MSEIKKLRRTYAGTADASATENRVKCVMSRVNRMQDEVGNLHDTVGPFFYRGPAEGGGKFTQVEVNVRNIKCVGGKHVIDIFPVSLPPSPPATTSKRISEEANSTSERRPVRLHNVSINWIWPIEYHKDTSAYFLKKRQLDSQSS